MPPAQPPLTIARGLLNEPPEHNHGTFNASAHRQTGASIALDKRQHQPDASYSWSTGRTAEVQLRGVKVRLHLFQHLPFGESHEHECLGGGGSCRGHFHVGG
jgi:hypothetical protein